MPIDLEGFNEFADVHDIDPEESVVNRLRFDDALEIPFQMTDMDVWANYVDDDLYELDKKVREYLKATRYSREKNGKMKTAVPLVFGWMFGRKPTPKDSQVCVTLHRLLSYYCTKKTGATAIKGQRFTHVYHFSKYAAKNKQPLSLRLRMELSNGDPNYRAIVSRGEKA